MTDLSPITLLIPDGWLVNNCYQMDDGRWRMNIRRPDGKGHWFTDWAEGSTLEIALEECISKLRDAEFYEKEEVSYKIAGEASENRGQSGLKILQEIGLVKRVSINRRV